MLLLSSQEWLYGSGAVLSLDFSALPGEEDAVGVDAVVEVRAELVED